MSPLIKNLLLALVLAAVLYLGYTLFLGGDEGALLTSTAGQSGEAAARTQEFLIRLQELQAIRIDDTLFQDPRFNALEDHRQPLIDVPTGRENPFAPAG